jgi:hypothetical protein
VERWITFASGKNKYYAMWSKRNRLHQVVVSQIEKVEAFKSVKIDLDIQHSMHAFVSLRVVKKSVLSLKLFPYSNLQRRLSRLLPAGYIARVP